MWSSMIANPLAYFNPRSHEGSDILQILLYSPTHRFQSTLPRGERPTTSSPSRSPAGYFNPRSHEGSDSLMPKSPKPDGNFNPRSHEGSDQPHCKIDLNASISIHAPTRGATARLAVKYLKDLFQSTLPRGERQTAP